MIERNPETDRYMEKRFGKPDYTQTFYHNRDFLTPLSKQPSIFRKDTIRPSECTHFIQEMSPQTYLTNQGEQP